MPKFIDRTGQRYSRLVVLEQAGRNAAKKVLWKCKCDGKMLLTIRGEQ